MFLLVNIKRIDNNVLSIWVLIELKTNNHFGNTPIFGDDRKTGKSREVNCLF